jgi:hypothetical protein
MTGQMADGGCTVVETVRDKIVFLLNKANDEFRSEQEKLSGLLGAQELLLNRSDVDEDERSALLHEFSKKIASFAHPNSSVGVKCFVITFAEQVAKHSYEQVPQILGAINYGIVGDSGDSVLKKLLQSSVIIYRRCLSYLASKEEFSKALNTTWSDLKFLRNKLQAQIASKHENIRSLALKFIESVALAHSTVTEDSSTVKTSARNARRAPFGPDSFSLANVKKNHSVLSVGEMRDYGIKVVQNVLNSLKNFSKRKAVKRKLA